MLPTNPQSMTTADKSILENLREQGAQIDRQARVMEKLVDRIARMMTAEERVEKKTKKNDREIKGDTKIKDVPGLLIDKLADKLDDSITKQFLKIKDSFKKEKQEPIDRSQEPASPQTEKEKKPKDETDTLKAILNSMIGNSKYQEQMTENSKALQSIADKTLTNVDNLNDNLKNIEQPEANNTEKENKTEEKNNKKEGKLNNNQKLAIAIGVSIAAALKPQFDTLGKTLKEALERGFANLADSIDNISGTSGVGVDLPLGGPDGKDGKGGKSGKGGFMDKAGEILKGPGLRRFAPLGIAAGLLEADQALQPERDAYFEEQRKKKEAEEAAAKANKSTKDQSIKPETKTETKTETKLSIEEIENRNKKIKDGTNTNIGVDGKVVEPAPAPVEKPESVKKSKVENKPLDIKVLSDALGGDAVAPSVSKMANIRSDITFNDDTDSQAIQQNNTNDQLKNNSRATAKAQIAAEKQKEKERLERVKAAESIDPKALEWAKKRYKDPNMSDPEYLSQEKNKSILEWLQKEKHQDYIKRNPNYNLEPKVTPQKKPEVKQQKNDKTGMLNEVTDTKMALVENKNTQPIVITNNNTNTGGGSDPAPIAFGSASPRNTSTAINDYFRNNGRLHDAAYG